MPTHKFKIGQTVFIKPSFSPKCPKDAAGSRCCEIRLLDYIEGVGQPLGYYAGELRRRGWKEAIIACHTMALRPTTSGKRYIDHWREAGFECETPIKNTGAGAAMMRIEAARRIFPRC